MHNLQIISLYRNKVQGCTKCSISNLEPNHEKCVFGGFTNDIKYFWLAQNPGYVTGRTRKNVWETEDLLYVFDYNRNNNTQMDEFLKFLMNQEMYHKSYFSNLVKCSTLNNKSPETKEIDNCFDYFLEELDYIKPEILITLGSVARNTVNINFSKIQKVFCGKIENLYHPTYVYSYNRNLINEYQNRIQNMTKSHPIAVTTKIGKLKGRRYEG